MKAKKQVAVAIIAVLFLSVCATYGLLKWKNIYKVSVSSYPQGADVYADGKPKGSAPCSFFLKKGKHKIVLIKPGFLVKVSDISVNCARKIVFNLGKPVGTEEFDFSSKPGGDWSLYREDHYIIGKKGNADYVIVKSGNSLFAVKSNRKGYYIKSGKFLYSVSVKSDVIKRSAYVPVKIYALDLLTGKEEQKFNFTLKLNNKKDVLLPFGIENGIAFFQEYFESYGPVFGFYIKAYSLKKRKLLYDKWFNAFLSPFVSYGGNLYVFESNGAGGLTVYSINEESGETFACISIENFRLFPEIFDIEKLEGGKLLLGEAHRNGNVCIVDLKNKRVCLRFAGERAYSGDGRYVIAVSSDPGGALTMSVWDSVSLKKVAFVKANIELEEPLNIRNFAYDSKNRRILFLAEGKLFCFDGEGKELHITDKFNKGYGRAFLSECSDFQKAGISFESGLVTVKCGKKVFVLSADTFEPVFYSENFFRIYGNILFLEDRSVTEDKEPFKVTAVNLNAVYKQINSQ